MTRYKRTQIGWILLVILGAGEVALIHAWEKASKPSLMISAFILLVVAMLFAVMTVIVDDEFVEVRFGIGLIRKKIPLREVSSCRVVKNPWWYGWGVRAIPEGWLFNVSGLWAVELSMKNGRVYRIGSNEPEELKRAIERKIAGFLT